MSQDEAVSNRAEVTLRRQTDAGASPLKRGGPSPGEANCGFRELEEAVLLAPSGLDCRLLIDDQELSQKTDSEGAGQTGGDTLSWTWTPGFYAGSVRAELLDRSDRSLGTWWLDVSPDPRKMGREIFGQMVEQIVEFDDRLLAGDEPAREQLGAVGRSDNPHLLFERLRRREDDLDRALDAIQREPASATRPRRQLVPFHSVRRADLRTVRVAVRTPAALAALRRVPEAALAWTGALPEPRFDVPQVERRLDAPINRCALYLLRGMRRRCRDLSWRFEALAIERRNEETRTELLSRLEHRRKVLARIEKTVRTVERRPPFADVRRPELTAAGLTAVAAHPLYSRFWRVGWEALRRGVSLLDPRDPVPLGPSWEVYEHWCFVEVARLLRRWLPDYRWSTAACVGGKRPRVEGRRGDSSVALYLQRTAPSSNGVEQSALWSVSKELRPDLVLRWQHGERRGFVVLDAKYRTGRRAVLDGMAESAHVYRDALRWGADRTDASLLLVPRLKGGLRWLGDEIYVHRHGVGAVALRPGTAPPGWLRGLVLGEASGRS